MPTLAIVHILSPGWTALITQSPADDVIFVSFRLLFFQGGESYFKAMQTTPTSQMTSEKNLQKLPVEHSLLFATNTQKYVFM